MKNCLRYLGRLMLPIFLLLANIGLKIDPLFAQDCPNPNNLPGACGFNSKAKGDKSKTMVPNQNLRPFFNQTLCGLDYAIGGVALAQRGTVPPGQPQPVNISISGIPPNCSTIVAAYAYWIRETDGVGNQSITIRNPNNVTQTFNANPIAQEPGGSCWGCGFSAHYRVDITAVISGNGNYQVSGVQVAPPRCNDTDGLGIVVIYRDLSATFQGTLVIYDGINLGIGGNGTQTLTGFNVCATPTTDRGFMILGDVQSNTTGQQVRMNGGPNFNITPLNFNIETHPLNLTNGQTTTDHVMIGANDCWTWIASGVYYRTTGCQVCGGAPGVLSQDATVCPENPPTLSITGGGNVIRWESSTDGGNTWTTINVQTQTYTPPAPISVNTQFRVLTNGVCGQSYSNIITVTVLPAPVLNPTAVPNTPICPRQSVTLDAGGNANNYTWNPGNIPGRTITVNPLVTTTYTVSGPGANGCIGTGTVTVTVFNNPPPITITPANPQRCSSDPPTVLTASGANTYLWSTGANTASISESPVITTTYTVTGTDANGCTGSASTTITVLPTPAQPSVITGATQVCSGPVQNAYSVTVVPNVTYNWTISPAGPTITNVANGRVNIVFPSTGTFTITVTPIQQGCVGPVRTLDVTVITIPAQPGQITGQTPFCPGGTGNYSITAVPTATSYTWSVSPNGGVTINSGQGTTQTNITFANAGTYTVSVTANNACGSSAPQTFTVVVNPTPAQPVVATNTSPVCPGQQNTTYSVVNVSGTLYTWVLPAQATLVSGQGTDIISVNWANNVTPGNYTLTVTPTLLGCVGPSLNITVTVNPPPPVQPGPITGATPVCQTQVATYSISAVADATNYIWSGIPAGANITGGQGTNQITVDWGTASPGVYLIQVIAANSCGQSPAQFFVVNVITVPATPGVIVGPPIHCVGVSGTYVITPVNGATSYTWTNSCGWSGTSSTNTIDYIAQNNGPCTISVTANNQCGSSPASLLTVNPLAVPAQPSVVNGRNIVCRGQIEQYAVVSVAGVVYTWSGLPSGASIASGQGTESVTIDWGTAAAGTYTITVTPSNFCGNGVVRTFRVQIIDVPSQPGNISGPVSLCENTSGIYSVTLVTGVTYTWSVSPAGPLLGQNGNSVEVSWTQPGTYVLTVTPRNQCGDGPVQTLTVVISDTPRPDAGLNMTPCGPTTILMGSPAGGTWSCEYCPGGASIQSVGIFGLVSGLSPDVSVVFKYELTDAVCGTVADYVLVRNDLATPGTVTGGGTVCEGATGILTLSGHTPTSTIVRWERSNDNFVSNIVPLSNTVPTYTYSNITETTQFRAVVILSGVCSEVHSFHATVVVVPRIVAQATPSLQTVCVSDAVVSGTVPVSGTGMWSFVSGPSGATIVTNGGMGIISGMISEGDYTFKWTVTNPPCPLSSVDVVVRRRPAVSQATAGPNQRVCGAEATLIGNMPASGTGQWNFVGGPSAAFVTTAGVQGIVTNMLLPGDYEFEWVITESNCNQMSSSRMVVTRMEEPSASNAGAHQEICGTTTTLSGNIPLVGTGVWSFVSGPSFPSMTQSGNLATVINLDVEGDYIFRYTITNSPCAARVSEVRVRKTGSVSPAQVTNTNLTACSNQLTLQAVAPSSGSGVWDFVSGPVNAVIFTNGINGVIDGMTAEGDYVFRWTVGNVSCGTSSVLVSVKRYLDIFPAAFAGSNQRVCDRPTALLQGSAPPVNGRGTWRFVSGPFVPSINQFGNFASVVNMDVAGDYVFSWTVENGPCAPSVSYVMVSRVAPPTPAVAGPSGEICGSSFTVTGNRPLQGTGSWSILQSAGGNPNLNGQGETATVSNITVAGTYIIRYTISNAPCTSTYADVVVKVNPLSVSGNLNANITTVCSGTNAGTLTLSSYEGMIVRWEMSTDDFNSFSPISNTTSTYTFNNLTRSTSYRVIVKQGNCAEAQSNVLKIVVNQQPIAANAGTNMSICGTQTVLTGNDPMGSVGTWSWVSGPLSPQLIQSGRQAVISGMTSAGDYVFRYTVSNSCGSTFADVLVSVSTGSVGGTLSQSATLCNPGSGSLSLSGMNGSIVRWEMSVNNGQSWSAITNTMSSYTYSGLTRTTQYRVVVKDGVCPSVNSNVVTVSIVTPVVSNAGMNQNICSSGTMLMGNNPSPGVGTWSQVSGGPVQLSQSGTRLNVSGLVPGGVYVFKWSIAFGGVCPASESQVTVTVGNGSLGGEVTMNQTICSGSGAVLNLSNYQGDILRWERSTNNWNTVLTIINTMNSLTVSNLTQTTRYRAVVRGGSCAAATSLEAVVSVSPLSPVVVNAGPDQIICGNVATVLGNIPSPGTGVWSIVSGPGNPILNPSGRMATVSNLGIGITVLRYTIERGACTPLSDDVQITVSEPVNAGFLTGGATLCDNGGGVSGSLSLSNSTGSVVRWEMSTDGFVTVQPISNTLLTYNYTNITSTTSFRVVVSSGSCGTSVSNPAVVRVVRGGYLADGGMPQTICGSSTTLQGNTPDNLIGTWTLLMSPNGSQPVVLQNNGMAQVSGMTVPGLYMYRYTLESSPCAASTADVSVTVVNETVSGTLSATPTAVCAGTNSGVISLTGNVGDVLRWESSTDGWITVTSISNTMTMYTFTNLQASTGYRVLVRSGNCEPVMSQVLTIQADEPTVGGLVSANATVCTGNNNGVLTLGGYRGAILRWEYSTDNGVTWLTINNTSPSQPYLNLTQSSIFRAVVQNGSCSALMSSSSTILVSGSSVGGTLSGAATVCSGSNSGSLVLSGHVGNIVRWESSTDMFFTQNVQTYPVQVSTLPYQNLTETTYYRVLVASGNCTPAYSGVVEVLVTAPGVGGMVMSDATVCTGSNSGTLSLVGNVGMIVKWQSSLDNITWVDIVNATPSLVYSNLTQTTWFRAVVMNGSCPSVMSQPAKITVNGLSVGGSISGNATVCPNINSGVLVLSGQVGSVVRWESSTDCNGFTNPLPLNNQTGSLTYSNLSQTTCYRAVVMNGMCALSYSGTGSVTVLPATNAGVISGNIGSCAGQASGTLVLSGNNGIVVRWESNVVGVNGPWTPIANNTQTLNYSNLSQTTWYRVLVEQSNCGAVASAAAEVSVTQPSVGGQLSGGNITVCSGSNGVLTLSGFVGSITRWEMSENNGPFMSVGNAGNASYTYTNLTQPTKFRVVVTSGVCAPAFSNEAVVSVNPPLSVSAVSVTGCVGLGSITSTATGGNGGYTYSIVPSVSPNNNNGVFTNIAAGSYTINVSDNRGCVASTSVTVSNVATPTSVTVVNNITTNSALVTWASVPPGVGVSYNLRYRILGEPNWTLIPNLTGTTRFLSGLQNNTTYEIEVQYVCPNNGPVSNFSTGVIHEFTTLAQGTGDCATSQPNNVPVPGGIYVHNINSTNAQVSWNGVLNAAGYIISFGLASDNPNSWAQFVVCNPTTTFLMTNLQPNTQYRVRIRTNCSNCTTALNNNDLRSNWSNQFSYITPSNREVLSSANEVNSLVVYPNPNKGNFAVNFVSGESQAVRVKLLDVTGREVLNRTYNAVTGDNSIPVELLNYTSGMYLLQVEMGSEVKTVKVVID